ncbi:MAG: pentapeptide repeat-containing protein [Gammaproteobacteria bacterium]|nr:pentapeptide repeat-containing protein [Gammaproteobacteria bacterium]NIV74532.1 hypothetical protein [Gammaproteobacteria bacterium]
MTKLRSSNHCPGCDLSAADFSQADLEEAYLPEADLSQSALAGAKLRAARLERARLAGAALGEADLSEAYAPGADFSDTNLASANLAEAFLRSADFAGAYLWRASLPGAMLYGASFRNARLREADLTGANLSRADLAGANLMETELTGANLRWADLSGALFEPKGVPEARDLFGAKGLATLHWFRSPEGLVLLQAAFQEAGMRRQEREVTYALKRSQRLAMGCRKHSAAGACVERSILGRLESAVHLLLFEAPSGWGLTPGRPLAILLALIPFFTVPYLAAIVRPSETAGIWRLWAPDRVLKKAGADAPQPVRETGLRAVLYALFFSLLSAFRIGWREFNVGDWISRLNPHEYTLRPTGWVRTVSGVQSLLSVYLLALAILTYFGRPFG